MGHASGWAERKKRVVDPGLGIYLANLMKRQRSMEIKELKGLLQAMEPRLDWEKQRNHWVERWRRPEGEIEQLTGKREGCGQSRLLYWRPR